MQLLFHFLAIVIALRMASTMTEKVYRRQDMPLNCTEDLPTDKRRFAECFNDTLPPDFNFNARLHKSAVKVESSEKKLPTDDMPMSDVRVPEKSDKRLRVADESTADDDIDSVRIRISPKMLVGGSSEVEADIGDSGRDEKQSVNGSPTSEGTQRANQNMTFSHALEEPKENFTLHTESRSQLVETDFIPEQDSIDLPSSKDQKSADSNCNDQILSADFIHYPKAFLRNCGQANQLRKLHSDLKTSEGDNQSKTLDRRQRCKLFGVC